MRFKTGIYTNSYNGYCYYSTAKNRKRLVHRVVWEEHFGKIPAGCEIHHKDGNKQNNIIGNLKIVTHKEHCNKYHPETMINMRKLSCEVRSRKSLERQKEINKLFKEGMSVKDIIQSSGFGQTTVYRYLKA